ncbi:MAG: AGE family epimerase/isomerase [Candidatus Latescibacterota bacterium]
MKRRAFLGTTIGTGAVAAGLAEGQVNATPLSRKATGQDNKLAGKTLAELREEHRYWLFDDFLPFMDKYVIDHDLGGFMTTVDRDGARIDSNKRTWFEGRGIWVYSYLYNKIKQDPKYLEAAQKSADFIMKQNPLGKELMPVGFTREGKPLENTPDPIFYGDVFVANGFQELSKIKGHEKYWDMAKQILLKCVDIYDNRPGYGDLPPKPGFDAKVRSEVKTPAENQPGVERPRVMGHWMVLLNCAQQMLETRTDPEVEIIAKRSVEAIVDYHYNPEYGLINEYVNHDLSRIKTDNYGQACIGHGPETLWMVLYEAVRTKDKALFDRTAGYLQRSADVFWDDVYGGMFIGIDNVEQNIWQVNPKAEWVQVEFLIGMLCVIEHTGAQWAKDWYGKLHAYVMEKLPLKQYGFPLWICYADRKVTFEKHYNRCEHFHHPRYLMQNMLALDRIIKRGGKTSGIFGA